MSKFALDMKAFVEKAKERADVAVRQTLVLLINRIDNLSPVGDPKFWVRPAPPGYVGGRFRGNWQLGVGAIPQGVLARIDPDGASTVSANIAKIPAKAAGHMYYYANNLPYARALEDGHSRRQAPLGIVGITVIEFRGIVASAVAAAKAQVP